MKAPPPGPKKYVKAWPILIVAGALFWPVGAYIMWNHMMSNFDEALKDAPVARQGKELPSRKNGPEKTSRQEENLEQRAPASEDSSISESEHDPNVEADNPFAPVPGDTPPDDPNASKMTQLEAIQSLEEVAKNEEQLPMALERVLANVDWENESQREMTSDVIRRAFRDNPNSRNVLEAYLARELNGQLTAVQGEYGRFRTVVEMYMNTIEDRELQKRFVGRLRNQSYDNAQTKQYLQQLQSEFQ